ncbi:hypothetical protein Leryth_010616 [Lithospermum erythrorhizon]|nr:hypothetical protein Leryth_010616 [Lithospermum erythrorhizon]
MNGEAEQQKQDRHRTRWTASLDKIFADLVVAHIQQSNRPNDAFDKKTWNLIRNEFNSLTNSNFNNNQLRKHLDVLRIRYNNLKSAPGQNDNSLDDPCYIGFDLWEDIGAQSRPEVSKMKECPIYDQLCTIFGGSGAEGRYAQSSHYRGLENPGVTDPSCPESGNPCPETPSSSKHVQLDVARIFADRKRKRALEESSPGQGSEAQEIGDAMANALLDMIASSRLMTAENLQSDNYYSISNCIRALDEMEGIDDSLYYSALDLFEDANIREVFLSLSNNLIRMSWLQGKCPTILPLTYRLGEPFPLLQ